MNNKKATTKLIRKNNKLSTRVYKLLETKSLDFVRKFETLSLLSNIKKVSSENSHIRENAECYINTLIESNGKRPSFDVINDFVSKSYSDYNKEYFDISGFNRLQDLKYKKNINESIVLDELNDININNKKIDEKLYETICTSYNLNTPLLYESYGEGKVFDASEFLKPVEKAASDAAKDVVDQDEKKKDPDAAVMNNVKKIMKFTDSIEPAVLNVVRNTFSNKAKRKFYLLFQIHFFLDVQREFNPPNSERNSFVHDEDIYKKFKGGIEDYSGMGSGLSISEIEVLKSRVDSILQRGDDSGLTDKEFFEDDNLISEKELISILTRSAGKSDKNKESVADIIEELNMEFPGEGNDPSVGYDSIYPLPKAKELSDKEAEELSGEDKERFERLKRSKGVPEMSDEEFEAETERLKRKWAEEDSAIYDEENENTPAFPNIHNSREMREPDEWVDITNMSDAEISSLPPNVGLKLIINADKSRRRSIYQELMTKSSSPEEFEAYVKEFFNNQEGGVVKGLTYADIARASGGDFKNSGGARQEIVKMWFSTIFYSADDSIRAKIFATLGDKWIEALRQLDLIEDETVNMPNLKSYKGSPLKDYLGKIEDIITRPGNIEGYISGEDSEDLKYDIESLSMSPEEISKNPEFEKISILHTLMSENSSFRVFATSILNKYYSANIWNSSESDIAIAIKEYFNKNFPGAGIDASNNLRKGKKSGVVLPEEGRLLFNPIIYWVMGRTGIKLKGDKVPDAESISNERVEYFKKSFPKKLDEYNNVAKIPLKMSPREIDDMISDMIDESGIIGSVYSSKKVLDTSTVNDIIDWINGMSVGSIISEISYALNYSETYKEFLKSDRLFNKRTEDMIRGWSQELVKTYSKAAKGDLKKHKEYLSDEYGYSES